MQLTGNISVQLKACWGACKEGGGLAKTILPPLFAPGPRAAGNFLSGDTLVLFLRQLYLERTSRSNCASVQSRFRKERQREVWRSLTTERQVDSIQVSHGPKKLSGCLGNVEPIRTMHSRWFAFLLWVSGQLELLGSLPR